MKQLQANVLDYESLDHTHIARRVQIMNHKGVLARFLPTTCWHDLHCFQNVGKYPANVLYTASQHESGKFQAHHAAAVLQMCPLVVDTLCLGMASIKNGQLSSITYHGLIIFELFDTRSIKNININVLLLSILALRFIKCI